MKDYTQDFQNIYDTLYNLNNNLCLLIDIIAESSVNESHNPKHLEISRN